MHDFDHRAAFLEAWRASAILPAWFVENNPIEAEEFLGGLRAWGCYAAETHGEPLALMTERQFRDFVRARALRDSALTLKRFAEKCEAEAIRVTLEANLDALRVLKGRGGHFDVTVSMLEGQICVTPRIGMDLRPVALN
jgi:hypothetical protein